VAWSSPIPEIEVFLAITSYANSNNMENPALFQVLGDTHFGGKGHYPVTPWLNMGGELKISLLNTVGDIGLWALDRFSIRARERTSSASPPACRCGAPEPRYQFDNSRSSSPTPSSGAARRSRDRRYASA
jgi:hypothetical protein